MIEHLLSEATPPARVVVIGAGGFVGGAIALRMERDGVPVLRVTRKDADLLAPDAAERLAALLRPGDSVVAAAAIAPAKTPEMLRDNLTLCIALVRALEQAEPAHVVNISSDAVFADGPLPLTEANPLAPGSYHGIMHLARETIFRTELRVPLAILRPTLVYGAGDPHNGYGPNQFRRKAQRGEAITLFGEGEERRDHIHVDDVAEIAARVLYRRSTGDLNLASGTVTSFREVAEIAVSLSQNALSSNAVPIQGSPRRGPMPHNGYRPFDIAACHAAFPDFTWRPLAEGMAEAAKTEFPDG